MALPSYDEAKQTISDPQSQFHSLTITKHVSLLPKYIGKLRTGIRECLNSEMKLYSSELDGVLMAYSNIRRYSSGALVFEELSQLHFDIQVDVIVFRPTVGCALKGMVNKMSENHLGCLVHNCFNASILKPHGVEYWEGSNLALGEEFSFIVQKVVVHNDVLFMRGKMPQDVSFHYTNRDLPQQQDASDLPDDVDGQTSTTQESPKKDRDKKRKDTKRKNDEIQDQSDNLNESSDPEPSRKKHKHNKNKDKVGFSLPDIRYSPTAHKHSHHTPSTSEMATDYITEQAADLLATLSKPPKHLKNSTSPDVLPCIASDSGVSSILSSTELNVSPDNHSFSKKKHKKDKHHKSKTADDEDKSCVSSPVTKKHKKHKKSKRNEDHEDCISSIVTAETSSPKKHKKAIKS